jgi:curved DNA-binding protein CbpA
MQADHYEVLGVPPEADGAAIRSAYLNLMRAHHPDRRPGDPASAALARRVNAAYAVLRDPARRAAYDRRRAPVTPPPRAPAAAPAPPPPPPAYSPDRRDYARAVSSATTRFLVASLLLGVILLLALGPR